MVSAESYSNRGCSRAGTVKEIVLDEYFFAIATPELPETIELDDDTIASVKTAGLIGERFIELCQVVPVFC